MIRFLFFGLHANDGKLKIMKMAPRRTDRQSEFAALLSADQNGRAAGARDQTAMACRVPNSRGRFASDQNRCRPLDDRCGRTHADECISHNNSGKHANQYRRDARSGRCAAHMGNHARHSRADMQIRKSSGQHVG